MIYYIFEELEKMCYSIKSSIMCGLIMFSKENLEILNNKLDIYFEDMANYKLEQYKINENHNKLDDNLKKDYYEKFEKYIDELNKLCQEMDHDLIMKDLELNNINLEEGTDISQLLK